MAIIKSCVKLIIKNSPYYQYSGKVLALGTPEIYATPEELKSWFQSLAGRKFPLLDENIKLTKNPLGKKYGWVSADTFLRGLGYSHIINLDLPGGEYTPDVVHDLNMPLPDALRSQFDLVIDPGTTEHVFDIKTALSSVVRALKIGGIIIHELPVYSFNGGYYSINPNVINDFYAANGFADLKTYIVMWDRYRAYTGKSRCYEYSANVLGARHSLADFDQCRYSPHLLFFARKKDEHPEINVPLQFSGEYFSAFTDQHRAEGAQMKFMLLLRRVQSLAYRVLPQEGAFYLSSLSRRILYIYQTRRVSFFI